MKRRSTAMHCIEAVLFDMDGVLIDSRSAWYKAFREVAPISRKDFDGRFWGRDLISNLNEIGADHHTFCDAVLAAHVDEVSAFEGAGVVLDGIKIKKGLVTNTSMDCTAHMLRKTGLDGKFGVVATPGAEMKGKPNPDMIVYACERLGVEPGKAVMVGDSEEDMAAGKAAGCVTVGIGIDGDYRIEGIKHLPRLLEKIAGRCPGPA